MGKIDKLYEILEKLEEKKETDMAAAVRWAISNLEQLYEVKL